MHCRLPKPECPLSSWQPTNPRGAVSRRIFSHATHSGSCTFSRADVQARSDETIGRHGPACSIASSGSTKRYSTTLSSARFVCVNDSPAFRPSAPQRCEGENSFTQLTFWQGRPCGNKVCCQSEIVAECLKNRMAKVDICTRRFAVIPPLTLTFAEVIPAPNDLAIDDED